MLMLPEYQLLLRAGTTKRQLVQMTANHAGRDCEREISDSKRRGDGSQSEPAAQGGKRRTVAVWFSTTRIIRGGTKQALVKTEPGEAREKVKKTINYAKARVKKAGTDREASSRGSVRL
ncbi:uncharacterized protein SPSK_01308 [Sporothrix schenckii 1099-18]|uniref:Uncharacterized protein n=1 Tax=Sporothrix schenckii 1099-18 TaxID=1397361 RepID=A0A0F2LV76_SPOSC|nr:uncharacterized protein SPSK_01308 [Sporothrix schenckii 1099-18]KJR81367.1 hypothetical protein SPSK_01308 [Sporothrix schenckii 1099-18]